MDTTDQIRYWSLLPKQTDHTTYRVSEFQSEFFSFVHGASLNYGYVAAEIAADTTKWGYQEIRRRRCYWRDKKKLMERIIRTTNISLWQKHKEKLYQKGLWADGVCCIIGQKTVWIGIFGDASILEVRTDGEQRTMGTINNESTTARKKLGQDRYDIDVEIAAFPFELGDAFTFAVGKSAWYSIETLHSYQEGQEQKKEGDGLFIIKHI
ncbi:MAG: hypothetical protein V1917_03520 [Candidatus Gottesmanbacteria bacterium]